MRLYTCDAVLSEAFYLLGPVGERALAEMLRRGALVPAFDLATELDPVVPMSLADACLVRMSETLAEPVLLTTDADFRVYHRHSRQVVPSVMPSSSHSNPKRRCVP